MNVQQLEYIVSVDEFRHFQKAANHCFVTPATLSMMVKKLEEELNVVIFDRSKKQVVPTDIGIEIIEKAKTALHYLKEIKHIAAFGHESIAGDVRIGIIPTLSPYITHLFLPVLMEQYPQLNVKLYEWNTEQIIEALRHNRLDIGIAATPLHYEDIKEHELFQEQLVAFSSDRYISKVNKKYLSPDDINLEKLWLLEEDHCLRSQVVNLCTLKEKFIDNSRLNFEAGSIETLMNIVNINEGITIIPELVIPTLSKEKRQHINYFASPVPVRQISLLTYRHFIKQKLIAALGEIIINAVTPFLLPTQGDYKVLDI